MDRPREAVFHQSINRPNLLMGGDRELVLFAALIAGILAFSLMTWWGVLIAMVLWPSAIWSLSRMAKEDPLMRQVYVRHIHYAMYYPAKSQTRLGGVSTPASWR
ncbi:MAG: conjugal transfer protein TrbD [Acidobacteriaceae bacterium]|nr:conjugal transfer protein TrbD [Acidobacteriaceae bacterium]